MQVDGALQASETEHIPPRTSRLPYMPGLDGLRALALIAVLLYHADIRWIPGGFLGVEVFFVLSGYLITALLMAEWQARQRIDLGAFWLRRARRLFPALLAAVGVTLIFVALFLPGELTGLRAQAAAAVAYMSNWYLILVRQSYFESMGRPSLLRHLWSLAVEGQFYLLWPPLLVVGLRYLARRKLPWYILAMAAASALWMALLYDPNVDPSRVYFGTDTRAAGFCIGAALALYWDRSRHRSHTGRTRLWLVDLGGAAALAGLVAAFACLDEFQPLLYRGGLALVAVATALVIAAVVHPHTRLCPSLLGAQPLRWLGARSYSIYLWHWPVFMVTRPQLDVPLQGLPLLGLRVLLSLALAECSYRLAEMPARSGRLWQVGKELRQARRNLDLRFNAQWIGFILAFLLLCVGLGQSVATATPPEPPSAPQTIPAYTLPSAHSAIATPASQTPASPTRILSQTTSPRLDHPPVRSMPTATPAPQAAFASPTYTPTVEFSVPERTASRDLFSISAQEAAWLRSRAAHPLPPTPVPTRVTIIGDSVMLGAQTELQQALPEADLDAAVGRQALEALQVLRAYRDDGQLGNIVIVHLGSNGLFRAEQFDEIMEVLAHVDQVMLVNVRVPRRWQDPVNKMLADGVKRYSNVVVIDWYAASADRPELFGEDGVHLAAEGAQVYTAMLVAALAGQGVVTVPPAAAP